MGFVNRVTFYYHKLDYIKTLNSAAIVKTKAFGHFTELYVFTSSFLTAEDLLCGPFLDF